MEIHHHDFYPRQQFCRQLGVHYRRFYRLHLLWIRPRRHQDVSLCAFKTWLRPLLFLSIPSVEEQHSLHYWLPRERPGQVKVRTKMAFHAKVCRILTLFLFLLHIHSAGTLDSPDSLFSGTTQIRMIHFIEACTRSSPRWKGIPHLHGQEPCGISSENPFLLPLPLAISTARHLLLPEFTHH